MPKIRAETARFPGKNAFQSPANFPNGLKQDMYVSGTPYAYKYMEKRAIWLPAPFLGLSLSNRYEAQRRLTEPGRLRSIAAS